MSNVEFVIENGILQQYEGTAKDVIISNAVTEIGERAFENNITIEKVTIPESVRKIGPFAFKGCKALSEIVFLGSCESIMGYAFESCKSLREVSLPEGITKLESGVFRDCQSLSKIHFPNSLKEIEHFSIEGSPLEELVLPDSVEILGQTNIKIDYPWERYEGAYKKIHLGRNLNTIGHYDRNYYEFFDIRHDTDFSFVFDVKCSGTDPVPYNLSGYALLPRIYTDFSVDEQNTCFIYQDGFLYSKDKKTLLVCMKTNVDEIIVPNGVETIMGHAFSNVMCGRLVIPGTVKNMIGSFVGAHIGELVLSEGITELQDQALLKSFIKSVVVPHSLKKLGSCVFLDVEKLTTMKLYTGMDYQLSPYYVGREVVTPFWFNKDSSFNDLEIVELYDSNDNFVARMGLPCKQESREVCEGTHYFLDRFLQAGSVLRTDLEPGRITNCTSLYKKIKRKDSKVRFLYGILSMPEVEEKKWSKAFSPDAKKYKKELLQMAEKYDDKHTLEIIETLLVNAK